MVAYILLRLGGGSAMERTFDDIAASIIEVSF